MHASLLGRQMAMSKVEASDLAHAPRKVLCHRGHLAKVGGIRAGHGLLEPGAEINASL
jgi:hypothetical protein